MVSLIFMSELPRSDFDPTNAPKYSVVAICDSHRLVATWIELHLRHARFVPEWLRLWFSRTTTQNHQQIVGSAGQQ
jgi:hypothetical protein